MAKIGVDVGGTFTDFILETTSGSSGGVFIHKVPSTPEDQSIAVLDGIMAICKMAGVSPGDVDLIVHGTTIATNITLEYSGAEVGMLTTRGFRDILHIARHKRPHNFSMQFDVPWQSRPLVKRRNRIPITERILPPEGVVDTPLDTDEVRAACALFRERGIDSVIICFLFAFLKTDHEQQAKAIVLEEMPDAFVSTSSEVVDVIREYERFSTTAMNGFVGPKVSRYLRNLRGKLKDKGLDAEIRIMQSNGGISTVEMCSEKPVTILLSGPAAGVIGGRWAGQLSKVDDVITVDIGGTSADISTIPGGRIKIMNPRDTYVGAYPVLTPMIDLSTIGAGGGSIAFVDEGGAFRVGPRSAGAEPGPVCYAKGGEEPTVTDAQVVLGRLDIDKFLGGELKIDADLARAAIETKLAKPMGVSVEDAALGIIRIINSNMALAIRANSVARGIDPRDFSLMPFGGAGPLHGVALAEEVSAKEVIVPPAPGINAAIGLLVTDMQYEFTRSAPTVLAEAGQAAYDKINAYLAQLEKQCRERLTADGVPADQQKFARIAECRYQGQGFELRADLPDEPLSAANKDIVVESFHKQHKLDYGYTFGSDQVEIMTLRVVGVAKVEPLQWPKLAAANGTPVEDAFLYTRKTTFDTGGAVDTPRYDRDKLKAGHTLEGPAMVIQHNSTTLIPPGYRAEVNEYGNIHIRAAAGS